MGRKVVLVGCGNMGYAMLKGWLSAGKLAAGDVTVVEPNEGLRARAAAHGVVVTADAGELAAADLVVFAVKPQVIRDVVPAYRRLEDATYLSVAAGTGVATFEELLGREAAVMRCMPNTPAAIGKGMMVVFANRNVGAETKAFVEGLLAASGAVATIDDEALMDAVTAVSGSGPAYVFHFIECLAAAGEKAGLPAETAKLLAMQTVYGAACLAKESGEEPGTLREQVTSPGGTTAAALGVLMGEERLAELVGEAVEAAKRRSVELGE
ncbi:pyrroline-5-carboxylate reductase [Chelativorans salis]|uniref:Pyrroline-5-carboxylate reductase n=1 Tax=Chelativorans salis TaxID=2978478 RepID=A0ABT2LLI6_9HYPH|nr:pyrroline-5-carboxylate reductase [Chelativorans sp. EGI FJ00035]MCT7374044.1 pyrroline-5-carboxylate reductase [Chelativorans sp. EGI FJ00035]